MDINTLTQELAEQQRLKQQLRQITKPINQQLKRLKQQMITENLTEMAIGPYTIRRSTKTHVKWRRDTLEEYVEPDKLNSYEQEQQQIQNTFKVEGL